MAKRARRAARSRAGRRTRSRTLTAKGRRRISLSNFAIPSRRAYPVNTLARARNALARVAQHGTPAEKRKVHAAVRRKWPALAKRSSVVRTSKH